MNRSGTLTHTILRDEASFCALQAEWESLFETSVLPAPFTRYSWARLCWNKLKANGPVEPFIVVIREADRVVLIAPFVAERSYYILRKLSLLDSGTPQFNDVLVEKSARTSDYLSYLWDSLSSQRQIRKLRLQQFRADALFNTFIDVRDPRTIREGIAPYIDLAKFGHWDPYFQSLPKKLRSDHRRQMKHLQDLGEVAFRYSTGETLAEDIAWLFERKRDWQKRTRAYSPWLGEAATEEFFTDVSMEGIQSGRTWLSVLTVGPNKVAATLCFRERHTLYVSKIAYDYEWQRYSPGRTCMLLTLERCFNEGLSVCELMIGDGDWKRTLATGYVDVNSKTLKLAWL